MPIEKMIEDIKHYAGEAKPNHAKSGFDEPRVVSDALIMIAAALEAMEQKRRKIEGNIAHRLGTLMAQGLDGEFIRGVILNAEPNYPFGKDDPDQIEFDKAVDDALRAALRSSS